MEMSSVVGKTVGNRDKSGTLRVEKTMALTRAEFAASLASLLGREVAAGGDPVRVGLAQGVVVLTCEPLAAVRLGGLLELPRARVVIEFDGVPAGERAAFLQRFDVAFQRGGG